MADEHLKKITERLSALGITSATAQKALQSFDNTDQTKRIQDLLKELERQRIAEQWRTDPLDLGRFLSIRGIRYAICDVLYKIAAVVEPKG